MMKRTFLSFGICSICFLAACQNNDSATNDLYEKSGNTINVNHDRADLYQNGDNRNINENFGYVRHQKSPIMGENVSNEHYTAIDREKLADMISKTCTDLPNVQDVATLVTDQQVLIIYDTESKNRNLTADQVKKTALSMVPRFYHVYVSDNTGLRNLMESYSYLDSDSRNAQEGMQSLIQKMKKSPQGNSVVQEENANGETKGD
jgi:hypothetical protein